MSTDLVQIEKEIQREIEAERSRLEAAAGLRRPAHFKRPVERAFTRDQRETTTVLFGGLTVRHERLIQAALQALGYQCQPLPVPDVHAFQAGKEFGNNGQCNPTYFTVGNLVRFLQNLEQEGLSRREIEDHYVFLTAGACGPCRFGMYEAEYRLALRNAGFGRFRVILFQQSGGLMQSDPSAGLEMNLDFFLSILNALCVGDVLNEAGYAVRPFEVQRGATNTALVEAVEMLAESFSRSKPSRSMPGGFFNQLRSDVFTSALQRAGTHLDAVEVDRLRVRPIVKITGEFWAQTTEGDGNFRMFEFLEREGAQVLVEPVGTWITYMLHQVVQKIRDTRGLNTDAAVAWWDVVTRAKNEASFWKRLGRMKLAEALFRREYHRLTDQLPGLTHHLADQYEMQRLGHPYYNSRAAGGEGHLEVAKNIYYANRALAHMVLSLKPFGCMPSTQSDAAQTAVIAKYPDMIYLPIETSGEGGLNAHSRVQMALGGARAKAKAEFEEALTKNTLTLERCYAFVEQHPELKRPLYKVPTHPGVIGVAANFVWHIADRMKAS